MTLQHGQTPGSSALDATSFGMISKKKMEKSRNSRSSRESMSMVREIGSESKNTHAHSMMKI